ncbi:hypothetical protein CWU58_11605 [Salmonella enterica]|nr:hypothetical protein [Salmonella enterica]ECE6803500.1 hypothetical protein [Salmonella enterica subsp. diarizonae]ECF8073727.1 hypothetical protein [Salmonella enterica]EEF8367281.1 hypothetical protein [Salmonella enterica]EEI4534823.1 hypothetical protein [Salmonella enterica]
MAKAKFFVLKDPDSNKYCWKFRLKDREFSSDAFDNEKAALENLENIIAMISKAPMYDADGVLISENEPCTADVLENSPIYFVFLTYNNEKWDWWCLKKGGGLLLKGSEEASSLGGFSSFDDALDSARKRRSIIEHAEIVDGAGVMIPYMLFSPEFSQKYEIGDMHPSYEFIKKNKI